MFHVKWHIYLELVNTEFKMLSRVPTTHGTEKGLRGIPSVLEYLAPRRRNKARVLVLKDTKEVFSLTFQLVFPPSSI